MGSKSPFIDILLTFLDIHRYTNTHSNEEGEEGGHHEHGFLQHEEAGEGVVEGEVPDVVGGEPSGPQGDDHTAHRVQVRGQQAVCVTLNGVRGAGGGR